MKLSTFFTGLLLVFAGTILFLLNLGYVSGKMVVHLLRWWPVLLIITGACLLWKGRIPRLLGLGIGIVLVSVTVLFFLMQQPSLPETAGKNFLQINRIKYPALSSARLGVAFGGGELLINSGTRPGQWLEADLTGLPVTKVVKETGNRLDLEIKQEETGRKLHRLEKNNVWALNLHPDLPWTLSIKTGAVKSRLNLTGIKLDGLNLASGAGDIEITLSDNGAYVPVKIEAGASNIKVRIPKNAGVQVRLRGALTHTNLPELGWLFGDKKYRSANYDSAEQCFDLELDIAVGRFDLERISLETQQNQGRAI